jgi:hypothetical protein
MSKYTVLVTVASVGRSLGRNCLRKSSMTGWDARTVGWDARTDGDTTKACAPPKRRKAESIAFTRATAQAPKWWPWLGARAA